MIRCEILFFSTFFLSFKRIIKHVCPILSVQYIVGGVFDPPRGAPRLLMIDGIIKLLKTVPRVVNIPLGKP